MKRRLIAQSDARVLFCTPNTPHAFYMDAVLFTKVYAIPIKVSGPEHQNGEYKIVFLNDVWFLKSFCSGFFHSDMPPDIFYRTGVDNWDLFIYEKLFMTTLIWTNSDSGYNNMEECNQKINV